MAKEGADCVCLCVQGGGMCASGVPLPGAEYMNALIKPDLLEMALDVVDGQAIDAHEIQDALHTSQSYFIKVLSEWMAGTVQESQ